MKDPDHIPRYSSVMFHPEIPCTAALQLRARQGWSRMITLAVAKRTVMCGALLLACGSAAFADSPCSDATANAQFALKSLQPTGPDKRSGTFAVAPTALQLGDAGPGALRIVWRSGKEMRVASVPFGQYDYSIKAYKLRGRGGTGIAWTVQMQGSAGYSCTYVLYERLGAFHLIPGEGWSITAVAESTRAETDIVTISQKQSWLSSCGPSNADIPYLYRAVILNAFRGELRSAAIYTSAPARLTLASLRRAEKRVRPDAEQCKRVLATAILAADIESQQMRQTPDRMIVVDGIERASAAITDNVVPWTSLAGVPNPRTNCYLEDSALVNDLRDAWGVRPHCLVWSGYMTDHASVNGAVDALAGILRHSTERGERLTLVTHSFGTVISYVALARLTREPPGTHPYQGISRYITLASPLGSEEEAFAIQNQNAKLRPISPASTLLTPKQLKISDYWLNVHAPGDPFGTQINISGVQNCRLGGAQDGDEWFYSHSRPYADLATASLVIDLPPACSNATSFLFSERTVEVNSPAEKFAVTTTPILVTGQSASNYGTVEINGKVRGSFNDGQLFGSDYRLLQATKEHGYRVFLRRDLEHGAYGGTVISDQDDNFKIPLDPQLRDVRTGAFVTWSSDERFGLMPLGGDGPMRGLLLIDTVRRVARPIGSPVTTQCTTGGMNEFQDASLDYDSIVWKSNTEATIVDHVCESTPARAGTVLLEVNLPGGTMRPRNSRG
jgi:pimeloyl-ACP methyl ester carboxylesterase